MPDSILKPLAFVGVLGVLIFVHELGHFLVAKLMNVKVVRFSLGFGPRVLGFSWGETEYWVSALPLGGYVKWADEGFSGEVPPEDRGRGFLEQTPWKRFLISVAGPAMNLLLPFFLFVGLLGAQNGTQVPGAVVGTVVPGSPADRAGLQPGDRIATLTAPGEPEQSIRDFYDLVDFVVPRPDQSLDVQVERGGRMLPRLTLRTGSDEQSNGLETTKRGIIGVSPIFTPARVGPVAPGAAGPLQPFDLVFTADGKPIQNALDLEAAVAAASCRPMDLEVFRERPRTIPGAVLADYSRERLAGVPSCSQGKRTFRVVDPLVAAAIAAVVPGSPGDRAGLRRGDVVTALNGRPVHTFAELADAVNRELAGAKPGVLTLADGRTVTLVAQEEKELNEITGYEDSRWTVGLSGDVRGLIDQRALSVPTVAMQRGPVEVVTSAAKETAGQVRLLALGIGKIFTRQINSNRVGSVIMMYEETGKAVDRGWSYFLAFVAFISVNLALLNLLPIPVLDGGNIAQSMVEAVTRRPLSVRARELANILGVCVLVALMLFAVQNDVRSKVKGWMEATQTTSNEPGQYKQPGK